jgi:Tol biopolymer transport system component
VPTRVAVVTNTAVPPTSTPLPATGTAILPTATIPPTNTATPQPTETAATQPTSVPPDIEGALFFFWDKEVPLEDPSYYSIPLYDPQQDLYMAMPDNSSPENWQTSPLLRSQLNWPDETTSWPKAALSPDKTKIAFTVIKKISDSLDVTSIYVADLLEGTIAQVTEDDNPRIYNISWLPDGQTILYSRGKEGFLARIGSHVSEQFTPTFSSDILKLKASPDGQLVAITLQQSGELVLINLETGNLVPNSIKSLITPNDVIWSPDSTWLALNQLSDEGLSLINLQSNEQVLLGTDFVGNPAWPPTWSSDGSQLAYMQGSRDSVDLYLWNAHSQTPHFVAHQGHHINLPVWSLEGNYLAIGSQEAETASLLVYAVETGELRTLTDLENVQEFEILSWSPDERWLLLFGASENQSCLYLVDTENGNTYCAVDSTGTLNPFEVYWVPQIANPH